MRRDKNHPCYQCSNRAVLCAKSCTKLFTYELLTGGSSKKEDKPIKPVSTYVKQSAKVSKQTLYNERKQKIKAPKQHKKLYTSRGE